MYVCEYTWQSLCNHACVQQCMYVYVYIYIYIGTHIYIYIYMIPVRPSPPPAPLPPPMVPPHPPFCGVVRWWVASPLPVVWCGPGVGLVGVVPPFPPVEWCVPAFLGLLWVFGILIPMMIMMMMMMGTMITIIINSSILMFDWLVVGCLLPTCLVFIALLIVGPLPS